MCITQGHCHDCGVKLSYAGKNRFSIDKVKRIIESVDGNEWINQNDYKTLSERNLQIRCGQCGEQYVASLGNYIYKNQTRCNRCSGKESYGEYIINKCLQSYNINFIFQAYFDDCYDIFVLPFDFYLPDYNLVIEYDGLQHYEPKFGEESFKKTLLHDGMKNNYCRWNNIDLLRIPYWERDNIEEILIKKLNIIPSVSIETKHHTIKYIPTKYRK